jgi:hypothetical protein
LPDLEAIRKIPVEGEVHALIVEMGGSGVPSFGIELQTELPLLGSNIK